MKEGNSMNTIIRLVASCLFLSLSGCAVSSVSAGYGGANVTVNFKALREQQRMAREAAQQAKRDLEVEYESEKAALNATIRANQPSVKSRFFKVFVGEKTLPISTRAVSTCGCGQ